MKRQNARIVSVLSLYNSDINSNLNIADLNTSIQAMLSDGLGLILDHESRAFSEQLTNGVLRNITKIDQIITANLFNWSLDRLSYVDRAIIRLACYEMLDTLTPVNIIIDEALEITKVLSCLDDDQQVKFTNKLLDKIKDAIANEK